MAAISPEVADSIAERLRAMQPRMADARLETDLGRLMRGFTESTDSVLTDPPQDFKFAALKSLPPRELAVLILHRRDGLTYEAIAKLLRITPPEVQSTLASGLRHYMSKLWAAPASLE